MKQILTETISIPRTADDDLGTILENAERLLIRDRKQPLRTVLLDLSATEATVLISFIHDTSE